MIITPYLCFEGRAEEAIEFYKAAVGAEVGMLLRMGDAPEGTQGCCEGPKPPADKIMHGSLMFGSTEVSISDGMCSGQPKFEGIALSMVLESEEQVKAHFKALADGGNVFLEPHKTFFSPLFAMVTDKFGVTWNLLVAVEAPVPA